MRKDLTLAEKYRVSIVSAYSSNTGDRFGVFMLKRGKTLLKVIACEASVTKEMGLPAWDHVSVSANQAGKDCTPDWYDMCYVKKLFFEDSECVMQLHVPSEKHVNFHEHCLHLWRPADEKIPLPPQYMV